MTLGKDYSQHFFDKKHPKSHRQKCVGVYYGGDAWFFESSTSGYGKGIDLRRVTAGFKTVTGHVTSMDGTAPGCAAVFKNALYVFGMTKSGDAYVTRLLGDATWTPKAQVISDGKAIEVTGTYTNPFGAMAATQFGDKLYLFYTAFSDKKRSWGRVSLIATEDGQTWTTQSDATIDVGGNVSACTYKGPDGTEYLMCAAPDLDQHLKGACTADLHNWTFLPFENAKGDETSATAVSVVPGSAPSGAYAPGHLQLQVFYNGKSKNNPLKRGVYDINTDTWHADNHTIDKLHHTGSWPCAVSNFADEGFNVRKRVWCYYPYALATDRDYTVPCVMDFQSDLLVADPSSIISQELDPTYRALWSLVGVLEGPPPYHLNKDTMGSAPTKFSFGAVHKEGTETSHGYKMTFFASASLLKGLFKLEAEYRHAIETKITRSFTFSKSVEYTFFPDAKDNLGYRLFLKPVANRERIDLCDYKGVKTGLHDFFFYVTKGSLQVEAFDLDTVRTSEIETFKDRRPNPDDVVCFGNVSWLPSIESAVKFGTEESYKTTNTTSNTIKIEASIGKKDIFHIGGGIEGTVTFEATHSTSINRNLGFTAYGPACGDPRTDHPKDVKSYNLTGYWVQARKGVSYDWIPAEFKGCRPWLFTWGVTNIQYQGEAAS